MSITIDLPETAEHDIVALSCAEQIPLDVLCFYMLAAGHETFKRNPTLLATIKQKLTKQP